MSLSQSQMTQEITGPVVAVAEDEEQGDPVPTARPRPADPSSQRPTGRRAEPGAAGKAPGDEAAPAAAQQLQQARPTRGI